MTPRAARAMVDVLIKIGQAYGPDTMYSILQDLSPDVKDDILFYFINERAHA